MNLIFVRADCPQLGIVKIFRFSVTPEGVRATEPNSFVWGHRDSQILGIELRTQRDQIRRIRDEILGANAEAIRAELED